MATVVVSPPSPKSLHCRKTNLARRRRKSRRSSPSRSSDSSTEDAAESFLGDWANPGAGEAAPIWPPADHQQAPSSAGDSPAAASDYAASVPASTFGEQTPAADDESFPAAASSELDLDHEARQPTSGADRQALVPTRQHSAVTSQHSVPTGRHATRARLQPLINPPAATLPIAQPSMTAPM